jgi:hypothetical protein
MSLIEHTKEQPKAKPEQRSRNGLFAPGNKLANGRPAGSRDKLTRAFLYQLADTFQRKGKAAMERLADEDPGAFIRVCASLMPKDIKLSAGPLADLSEHELSALAYAAQRLAEADESEVEDHR